MRPNPQFPVDLVTFTEEILHEKLFAVGIVQKKLFAKNIFCSGYRALDFLRIIYVIGHVGF